MPKVSQKEVREAKRHQALFQKARQEILEIPKCEIIDDTSTYCLFKTDLFFIRLLDQNISLDIHLAERATFDRWANSRNFETSRTKESGCYYPLFWEQYKWAEKVLKSKLFNFNSYFDSIHLPRFEVAQND